VASGNTLLVLLPTGSLPPTSNYATLDTRGSGHWVLDFDAATNESTLWADVLPRNYAGGGLTVTVCWMSTGATSGDVVWQGQFERHQDETDDLDSDSFAAAQSATGTAAGTNGAVQYTGITFTAGAQMDSLAAGEHFRFKLIRNAADAADTMAGDAEVLSVEIRET